MDVRTRPIGLTARSDFGRSVSTLNVRPGKSRRSPRARRRWAAPVAAVLALLGVAPSSLLAEDDDATLLRVSFDGRGDMFLDPGLVDGVVGDPSWTILANTNNGLLAFKREKGQGGTEIEPDLAEAMPTVSSDGKTYTFTIRGGVKFSEEKAGEVKPSDVKASIERALYLESDGKRFLLEIDGAPSAAKRGAQGGGIRGIEADDRTRTLTIRLTKPDPAFLKVLAMPWTFVLPKDTPLNDESTPDGAPATGPYMIRRFEPDRLVQLVQNPRWDQQATDRDRNLPQRFRRIEISIGISGRDALERIRGGESDLTLSPVLPADLKRFEGRPEVQIKKERPLASIVAFFMNTRSKPFDKELVRKAVNVAVDRERLAGFFQDQAVETAQTLPPTFTGYRRQRVRKPDLAQARRLIKLAKLTGDDRRVTIWSNKEPPVIAASRYLQSVLKDLGFNAEITYLDGFAYQDRIGQRSTQAQIGYLRWFATVPDGADLFRHLDSNEIRRDENPNLSYYKESDVLIDRARAERIGPKRDSAWLAVDQSVSDHAPWVPFATLTKSDMTSSRIEGYVYSPVFGQLWSLMRAR